MISLNNETRYREIFNSIQQHRKEASNRLRELGYKIAEPHWKDPIIDCVTLDATVEEIRESIIFFHGSEPEVTYYDEIGEFFITSKGYSC